VSRITPPYCNICGQNTAKNDLCIRCAENPPRINAIRSWGLFDDPLRKAIHSLKYQRDIALGDVFTNPLIHVLDTTNWQIDLITPVPLGIARQRERGYNQSSLLARPIALKMGIQCKPKAISRIRETISQIDLTREQRRENVAGAFQAGTTDVYGKNILLVDDVATSGSTLDSCADALFQAGALKVYGLTLARA
jgi:ComF family protein